MSTTTETAMCEAVARSTLLRGRNPRTCAAHASATVEHEGLTHPVCQIHRQAWERGDHDELGTRWGWHLADRG